MNIRPSTVSDHAHIEQVHLQAFGEEGDEIVQLVNNLFEDKTALPLLSLVAVEADQIIGHVLYTKATLTQTNEAVSVHILAPLAVTPSAQNKGVGQQLIKEGLRQLKATGTELVLVLGHPGYYPRAGFVPAGALGFEAPYPIPEKDAGAWMVQELCAGVIGRAKGKVQCAEALSQEEYWRE